MLVKSVGATAEIESFEQLLNKDSNGIIKNNEQVTDNKRYGFEYIMLNEIGLNYWFLKYGNEYGLSVEKLKKIAGCESGLRLDAVNYIYAGLFQFAPATWRSNRKAMGLDDNINLRFDAEESIRTAAFKIARDGTGAWPVCQFR